MDHLQGVLDLSVVFTQPPPNSAPEVLACVAFRCDALDLGHTGEVFIDPLTQREREDLRWYLPTTCAMSSSKYFSLFSGLHARSTGMGAGQNEEKWKDEREKEEKKRRDEG